ncbi:MAG: sigma 54-interacting transcriptional regulator [Myxococcaceae bacterium]
MTDGWTTHVIAPGEERLRTPGFRLLVTRGPDKGAELRAMKPEVTVGSQEGCELRLSDPAVSRHHLSVSSTPEGFRVRDLGSTNGTFVKGARLLDGFVEPGAELELGESRLKVAGLSEVLEVPLHAGESFGPLLGRAPAMRQVMAMLEAAARTEATVLLLGETGTGKDLAAEALHQASPRSAGPFVVVDCGAIPEALIESELFGHEKGAFTGAAERRVGAFEAAAGGTVFLDEVGDLPLAMQPKLLRVLEKRTVKPVGANTHRPVDARFIAATHRDLRAEVNRGTFREDLYFRLAVITLRLPPLRERREDLPMLAEAFLRQVAPKATLSEAFRQRLGAYDWPGNARELRHAVERMAALGEHAVPEQAPTPGAAPLPEADPSVPFKDAKQRLVDRFERAYLAALLERTEGNASAAAREAGLDRVHLLKLLRRHGLR